MSFVCGLTSIRQPALFSSAPVILSLPELVLTAGHLLAIVRGVPPAKGATCEVQELGVQVGWQRGEVLWPGDSHRDVALVTVPQLGNKLLPAQFGRLDGFQVYKWRAVGFPAASLDDFGRNVEDAWGKVSSLTHRSSGQLGLTVESRGARRTVSDHSGWSGLSGSSVFCGDVIVGVIVKDPAGYEQSLVATRIESVANDLLPQVSPTIEPIIKSTLSVVNCSRRRVFNSLLKEYHVGFGGRIWVLEDLHLFLNTPSRRNMIVEAPPGFGKTAVFARLVKNSEFEHAYHFLRHDDPDNQTERAFLASILEQFAALAGQDIEINADDKAWTYGRVLELAEVVSSGSHVLVVDGLDEVAWDAKSYIKELQNLGLRTLVSRRMVGMSAIPSAAVALEMETIRLQGLTNDDITLILDAVGVPHTDQRPRLTDEIMRIARTDEPDFSGADPFIVRFIAEDVVAGQIDTEGLGSSSPGVERYLDKWFDQIVNSAKTNVTSLWAIRFLASAKGPLPKSDLEALLPTMPDQVLRPTLSKILAPVRRHLRQSPTGFGLAHKRLAEFVRARGDPAADEQRIVEYCKRWPITHSSYALSTLVQHLLDAGDDDAVWNLLTDAGEAGANPWYLAHILSYYPLKTIYTDTADPLRSYLNDLEAMVNRANEIAKVDRQRGAIIRFRAAALKSTSVSVSYRVPGQPASSPCCGRATPGRGYYPRVAPEQGKKSGRHSGKSGCRNERHSSSEVHHPSCDAGRNRLPSPRSRPITS